MPSLLDQRQVRRGFDRAAAGFDAAAALPGEVRARLLGSLDYLDDTVPAVVLDLGSGTGHAAAAMKKRWPKSQVLALDLSLPMLRQSRRQAGWWRPFTRLCADAHALPLADGSVDLVFANLSLAWMEDLPAVFAGLRRVLRLAACCCARVSARKPWANCRRPSPASTNRHSRSRCCPSPGSAMRWWPPASAIRCWTATCSP